MPFNRWRIEHPEDEKSKLFIKFLKDHNFAAWSAIRAAWGSKCQIPADAEYGMTIKDEVLTLIGGVATPKPTPFDPDDVIGDKPIPAAS